MTARTPAAAAALLAIVALTGCSTTIDGAKGEQLISRTVEQEVGVQVRGVRCPRELVAKAGERFRCTVTGTDGSTGEAIVTERDDKGAVSIEAPFLPVGEVEASIGQRLAGDIGGGAYGHLPGDRRGQRRARRSAAGRGPAATPPVRVVQQDDSGASATPWSAEAQVFEVEPEEVAGAWGAVPGLGGTVPPCGGTPPPGPARAAGVGPGHLEGLRHKHVHLADPSDLITWTT